jgi:hypothetical protein
MEYFEELVRARTVHRPEPVRSRPELVSFKLDRILDAYDTFGDATKSRALKVIIEV